MEIALEEREKLLKKGGKKGKAIEE